MTDDEKAKQRFMLLQLARLSGIIMAGLGVLIISGRLVDNPPLGYALFVVGAIEFFVLPIILAKRWKSPRP
ncbi:hypothetical protein [Parerythrobacter jejuensis]|uniref:Uncharacterized protein n=1 Tax=Parerythrobacter jejuensis TaxID=795812 RepID=A0A845AQ82_9SPHN|nr:hypothetical protein [Parerythrobacter jejuensis]MXP31557.1 hypothetical protein [Parerythrobacter jejuensis]